jgi:diacylglycerol kinase (ATP)
MMVLLNPHAAGGRALAKWQHCSGCMPPPTEPFELLVLAPDTDAPAVVRSALARGERHFVAAGGDGTVHWLVNLLMQLPAGEQRLCAMGAVGLGSSNDFHKPLDTAMHAGSIPCRMDFSQTIRRDVGCVRLDGSSGASVRYFLINASAGITAEGNRIFNSPDPILAQLKRCATPAAILYAAIRAIVAHRNVPVTLEIGRRASVNLRLTNLGIVKNPHFSGSLHYSTHSDYTDGRFRIFAASGMGILRRFRLLSLLSHGRFHELDGTRSWSSDCITISSALPIALELDGEIVEAERAEFTVLPQALQVCV